MKKTGHKPCAVDTNIVIDLFKGNKRIAEKMDQAEKIYLPVQVLGELHLGAVSSNRKKHHLAQIAMLLKIVEQLNTSERTAEIYGIIKAELRRKGNPIPENDIWIAALAMEHNLPVVTHDKHFRQITGIKTLKW